MTFFLYLFLKYEAHLPAEVYQTPQVDCHLKTFENMEIITFPAVKLTTSTHWLKVQFLKYVPMETKLKKSRK